MTDQQLKRVQDSYAKLGIREPFIAAVMTKVRRELSYDVPTAATNGSYVKYNPDFVAEQTDAQLFGLTVHESLHVVLMHMWRRENRDPRLWNYANDAIINKYIRDRRYELPEGGVSEPWVTDAMSSEEVYERLKKNPPPPPKPQPQGSSGGTDDGDGDEDGAGTSSDGDGDEDGADTSSGVGGSGDKDGNEQGKGNPDYPQGGFGDSGDLIDADDEATLRDLESTIVAAAQMAKKCGQGSSLIDRILETVGVPTVPWFDVLRHAMTEARRDDYSFSRPRRRYVADGIYLPALHSEALAGLMVGADMSGSMWGDPTEVKQIGIELNAVVQDTGPAFVELVYCDTEIMGKVDRFDQDEEIKFRPKQGGGTELSPVFNYLEQHEDDFCCLVFFTDMCVDFSMLHDPGIPVIWACTDINYVKTKVPFGSVVHVSR
jgi:predicted metal-dependent peptidase